MGVRRPTGSRPGTCHGAIPSLLPHRRLVRLAGLPKRGMPSTQCESGLTCRSQGRPRPSCRRNIETPRLAFNVISSLPPLPHKMSCLSVCPSLLHPAPPEAVLSDSMSFPYYHSYSSNPLQAVLSFMSSLRPGPTSRRCLVCLKIFSSICPTPVTPFCLSPLPSVTTLPQVNRLACHVCDDRSDGPVREWADLPKPEEGIAHSCPCSPDALQSASVQTVL